MPTSKVSREEKAKAKARADKAHERYVQKTYGLAPGEYAEMLARQEGRCAICRNKPVKRKLAVDHDHVTQKIRGLLCYLCNKNLGQYETSYERARNASDYLNRIAADWNEIQPTQAVRVRGSAPSSEGQRMFVMRVNR